MTSSTEQANTGEASSTSDKEFLLFTLGPVQRFIAAARKTSDLWAGSGLLSWLAEQAMKPIIDKHGTDVFIFPYIDSEGLDTKGRAISYPNRFVALVPEGSGDRLASKAQEVAQEALVEVVDFGLDRFDIEAGGMPYKMAQNQAETFLECYWSILPQDEALSYGEQYRMLEQQLGARKSLRNFEALNEPGYRCDLIPSLGALVPEESATPGTVRRFWKQQARHLPHRYLQDHEELSGVALAKRLFPDFKEQYANTSNVEAFPSTSSFATADFKAAVLEAYPHNQNIKGAVSAYESAMRPLVGKLGALEEPIPQLYDKASAIGVSDFPSIGGRWLFPEAFDRIGNTERNGMSVDPAHVSEARTALRNLISAAREANIPPPSRYYALLLLDGDNMGAWLSGEKNPTNDRVSRSYHEFVSHALGHFAQAKVPEIVENEYSGKLVYSGGDDVMALVSLRDALPMARSIRAAFSGQRTSDGDVDWNMHPAFNPQLDSTEPTMGVTATASAGVVVAHHMQSLDQVLQTARDAESYAKYELKRDALAIAVMKRSGEHATTGGKWFYEGIDIVDLLHSYMTHLQDGTISTGFLHTLADAEPSLRFVENRAISAEIARVLERQSDLPDKTFLNNVRTLLNQEQYTFGDLISLLSSAQFLVRGSLS